MRQHHTKNKGDLGALKAQLDLFEKGYLICTPQTEHAQFDLVAYKNGNFLRIQVKYRSVNAGKIDVQLKTSWSDKKGKHTIYYDKNEIDLFCVYCPDTDECYYFDPKTVNNSITLRAEKPKNCQRKGIHLTEDYRKIPQYLDSSVGLEQLPSKQ